MSMRCSSKCVVGRRSRALSLLVAGTVIGFTLSMTLQTLNLGRLQKSGQNPLQKVVVDYRGVESGKRVEFSNLDRQYEAQIDLGEYDYDRLSFNSHNLDGGGGGVIEDDSLDGGVDRERLKSMVESPQLQGNHAGEDDPGRPQLQGNHAGEDDPGIPADIPKDLKLKQFEYRSENWQGRNVRESKNGLPPIRLSDELAPRQTYVIAVVTTITKLMSQTLAIHGTWGPEAIQVIYFVGEVHPVPHLPHGMNVIQLDGIQDDVGPWDMKELTVVKYLIDNYLDTVDWFVIVSDETYIVTDSLDKRLNRLDPSVSVYLGRAGEVAENGKSLLCSKNPGIIYSRGLFERLKPYLPLCWPGQGEMNSLSGCISVMGVKCTQAKETEDLLVTNARHLVESTTLFSMKPLSNALMIHPVMYPKYIYRLHSYFKERDYNATVGHANSLINVLHGTHPFIPSHMRSAFHPAKFPSASNCPGSSPPSIAPPSNSETGPASSVIVRPRYVPKNKFEINYWEYFNQTRLMSIMNESPARGIIGGVREEARFALTKAIYQANQGVLPSHRYVFDKLENGYHRVDPMRGSEFILDFVFRKASDKTTRVRKRLSILRPYYETIVPIDTPEHLPTVNFIIVLSGLSDRLNHFLAQYEQNVLQLREDSTLTIVLFDSPDASKVRLMIQQYTTRYAGAVMTVLDAPGTFARGVGLDIGVRHFKDGDLLFLVDVDLDISTDFLQRCRLNTIHGKQVYFPVFFKLYNPDFVNKYHPDNSSMLITRHRGHWAHYSYGMVCMFASDYHKSGGFDTSMKGWGEEDVDLLNKVTGSGLEAFRAPDPGLVHNWHRKVCDKNTVSNPVSYEHCLQSKGENLADRVELAQYVFENELRNGNVL